MEWFILQVGMGALLGNPRRHPAICVQLTCAVQLRLQVRAIAFDFSNCNRKSGLYAFDFPY
jgi:hypothetical protein